MFLSFAARARSSRPPPQRRAPFAWLFKVALLLLAVAGVLAGLILLGHWSLEHLRGRERYLLPLADVECTPPPGLTRGDFLEEVRYYADLPERLSLLDETLPARLRAAFAEHPWVARVQEVTIEPPRQVRVRLEYRQPVLAVPWGGALRAVDAAGVLLPARAPTRGLPVYDGQPRPPQGRAGTPWGDADLEKEARRLGK
jgi:hypothetical protein